MDGRDVVLVRQCECQLQHPHHPLQLLEQTLGHCHLPQGFQLPLDSLDIPEVGRGVQAWDQAAESAVQGVGPLSLGPVGQPLQGVEGLSDCLPVGIRFNFTPPLKGICLILYYS